jgi:hypothetical protein
MKIWQLVCGSVLVLSMTSCGNKEAAAPPVEKPPVAEAPPATTAPAPATTAPAPATTAPAPATTASAPATTEAPPKSSEPPVKKSPALATATKKAEPPVKKSPAPETAAATSTATGSGFPALKTIIGTTKKAGEAANFDVATTEFSKFEDAWKTVEDKVKAKKPAEYKAIETTVEAANMAIAKKDKTALLSSLQKLSGMVDKASK